MWGFLRDIMGRCAKATCRNLGHANCYASINYSGLTMIRAEEVLLRWLIGGKSIGKDEHMVQRDELYAAWLVSVGKFHETSA